MGFRSQADPAHLEADQLLSHVRAEDLIEYGFESEFIGRLPVIAVLHGLGPEDLLEILRNPKAASSCPKSATSAPMTLRSNLPTRP